MSNWNLDLEAYKTIAESRLSNSVALEYAAFFKNFFRPEEIEKYEWKDIQKIGANLHCFQSMAIARSNALGKPNHDIKHYRRSFMYLAHGEDEIVTRIDRFLNSSEYSLFGFGISAVSELCAYLFADKVFMRNSRDIWAAERYLLTPNYKRGNSFGQKLLTFGFAMVPLVKDYEAIVGRQTALPLNLEVDQFLSYIYEQKVQNPEQPKSKQFWAVGTGADGFLWDEFRQGGFVGIGFGMMSDLGQYESRDSIAEVLQAQEGSKGTRVNDSLAAWQFSREMKQGDVIIAKQGFRQIYAVGTVVSDYEFEESRTECRHIRRVEWQKIGDWTLPRDRGVASKTLTNVTKFGTWLDMVLSLTGMQDNDIDDPKDPESPIYSINDALNDLFMSGASFKEMLTQLRLKQNAVLQGPPGVGKTFVAKRLAYTLMGEKDPTRVEMVQFHQSYSYEDFVQGLRPNHEGKFQLQDGVFYRFCKKAADDDRPYVFIIDEINRGNLSRILGELMMLIESDKRGPEWAVSLTYGGDGERFYVPKNVYILGTMNTADRSLALVDYALRRRFAFLTLDPAFGSEGFREHLENRGVPDTLIAKINGRISRLNAIIADDTKNLGPGFKIGHSYFCPGEGDEPTEDWFRRVVKYEIMPLLDEYWFDDDGKVSQASNELLAP